jgi:xanthine dehydrogenase YagS FAD-binding subunit
VRDFAYARATTAGSVIGALADPDTAVIAGGTELLNWFRLGITAAGRVVDIGGLDELRGITRDGDELRIGALATLTEIGEHPLVTRLAGALASACLQAASAQVRNRATIGGNVLQRTRCPYFRAEEPVPWPCSKRDPGSGCAALAGRHERQAIFGWTHDCVAVQPSDPAVALAALDAQAEVLGPAGPRTIPMREFHLTQREAAGLGEPRRETRLGPDELITGYRLPASMRGAGEVGGGQAYVKVRERASYEYAIVSAAAAVRLTGDGSRIATARIALGSVAQRPWRLAAAEAELPGTPLTREALTPVIERAMADAAPLPQNGFKVRMARAVAVRSLLAAGGAS